MFCLFKEFQKDLISLVHTHSHPPYSEGLAYSPSEDDVDFRDELVKAVPNAQLKIYSTLINYTHDYTKD